MWANYSDLSSVEDELVEPLILNRIRRPKEVNPWEDYFFEELRKLHGDLQEIRLRLQRRKEYSDDPQPISETESEEPELESRIPSTVHQTSDEKCLTAEVSSEPLTLKECGRPSSEHEIQMTKSVCNQSFPVKDPNEPIISYCRYPMSRFFPEEGLPAEEPLWMKKNREIKELRKQRAAAQAIIESIPEIESEEEPEKPKPIMPWIWNTPFFGTILSSIKHKFQRTTARNSSRRSLSTAQPQEPLPVRRMPWKWNGRFLDKITSSIKNKFQWRTRMDSSRSSLPAAESEEEQLPERRVQGTTHSCELHLSHVSESLRWCCSTSKMVSQGPKLQLTVDLKGQGKLRAYYFEIIRVKDSLSNLRFRAQLSPGGYFRITKAQRLLTVGLIFGWLMFHVPVSRPPIPRPPVRRPPVPLPTPSDALVPRPPPSKAQVSRAPMPDPQVLDSPVSDTPLSRARLSYLSLFDTLSVDIRLFEAPPVSEVPDQIPAGMDIREEDERMSSDKKCKSSDSDVLSNSPKALTVTTYTDYEEFGIRVDGMSLFRALVSGESIARQTCLSPRIQHDLAIEYRKRVVAKLVEDGKCYFLERFIEDDFEKYVKRMSAEETYGGEAELSVACEVVKAPIRVFMEVEKNGGLKLIAEYGSELLGNSSTFVDILYKGTDYRPEPAAAAVEEIVKTS